jgi:hypothetical protein
MTECFEDPFFEDELMDNEFHDVFQEELDELDALWDEEHAPVVRPYSPVPVPYISPYVSPPLDEADFEPLTILRVNTRTPLTRTPLTRTNRYENVKPIIPTPPPSPVLPVVQEKVQPVQPVVQEKVKVQPVVQEKVKVQPVVQQKKVTKEEVKPKEQGKKFKMCAYHLEKKCTKGSKCTYAHHIDEIAVSDCAYGAKCNRYKSKENPCGFYHASLETKEQYLKTREQRVRKP